MTTLRTISNRARRWFAAAQVCVLLLPFSAIASAQAPSVQSAQQPDSGDNSPLDPEAVTLFPHSNTSRYWISGQDSIIFQWHPSFPAKYSGPNSLRDTAEHATSNVATLYLGYQVTKNTEAFFDLESASGGADSATRSASPESPTWTSSAILRSAANRTLHESCCGRLFP